MPTDDDSGWVEPDIIVNGRALSFAECMAVRVAIGNFRISLTSAAMRVGLGEGLADGYDRHLARVEQTMLRQPDELTEGWALRSDSLKSRAMHYFRDGRSLCARQWPQQRVALYPEPKGMACPECLKLHR
jgi:hypothetical protein